MSFFKEAAHFLKNEKKWWLIPLAIFVLIAIVVGILFASSSGISWAIYR